MSEQVENSDNVKEGEVKGSETTHVYEPAHWEPAFLTAFRLKGNVTEAAELAGITTKYVYQRRKEVPEFAELWKDAEAESSDRLEKEARRRAEEGTEKYVINKGNLVWVWVDADGNVTNEENGVMKVPLKEKEYSDSLMALLLRAHKPEKYKDRVANEVSGPNGAPVQSTQTHIYIPDNGRNTNTTNSASDH